MAVQFILGRAGSGKTRYCLDAIREQLRLSPKGPPLVLLVPEQATYQTERALVTTPGLGGYARAHVLSFRRLAYQVLLEVGGCARTPLDGVGKQMILRSILRRRAGSLELFDKSARQRGFVERLALTLSELRSYGHGAGRLRVELARLEEQGEGQSLLAVKLRDLATVADDYERFIGERYLDPDSYLDHLAEKLRVRNRFHGCRVWVDGFASFTGQEERVLGVLMDVAVDVKIALCLDPVEAAAARQRDGRDEGLSMFVLLRETYERLTELARSKGKVVLPPVILPAGGQPTRFSASAELAALERRLFAVRSPGQRNGNEQAVRSVVVTAAPDQRCEVRNVANEILRLCREEGYRFRDIAVIVRDLTPYRALIETIFGDYEIPHFMDVRREIAHHPLVELIRSALDVVVRGWRTEDVLRYAKTDLAGLDREAADWLENYVLAHGIEGEAWRASEPWRYRLRYTLGEDWEGSSDREPLEAINDWREKLCGPLRQFERDVCQVGQTVLAHCRALFGLLESLGVADVLESWAGQAESEGRLDEADEHRQIWGAVTDLLDQAVAALGDEHVDVEEFREVIETGLAAIRLRLVPPALDQVLVGSIERSRHPEIRAAFVLGLNERIFPQPQLPDVIFGDRERERLAEDGLRLGPVSEKRLLHERFLAYIAFTRPSERLYVSYAEADPMGKVLHPSPYFDELRRCFGTLEVRRIGRDDLLDGVGHWRGAMSGLARALRPQPGDGRDPERIAWAALYNELRRDGEMVEMLARRIGGLAYENKARLRRQLANRLYGAERESSITRLECFAACPFKHFARYGLGLEERRRFRLETADLGLFYHAVLKQLYERLSGGRALSWGEVEPAEALEALERAIDSVAADMGKEILLSSGRNRYLLSSARAAMEQLVRVMIEFGRRDRFRQVAAEVAFGGAGAPMPPIKIRLADGGHLLLRGRIDRVDVSEHQPAVLRVIDYKTAPRRFQMNELAYGLALQLPAYLLALDEGRLPGAGGGGQIAGALYVPIHRRVQSKSPGRVARWEKDDENRRALQLRGWQARGFFDSRWAGLFDAKLFETSGLSPIVALSVTRKGELYAWGKHDALPEGALRVVKEWTRRMLARLTERVFAGEVGVRPYQLGGWTACRWCAFRAVCRYDGQRQRPRVLENRRWFEAFEWIKEQLGE